MPSRGRPGFWKSFNPRFYGWRMLPAAWLIYGLGAVPFYSWGIFLPQMLDELGMSRADSGWAFGIWTFCGGAVAPLIGVCLTRFGPRPVFTAGFLAVSVAYYLTSRAQDRWDVLLYFGLFAGVTHTFSTVLPTQTLAANWFLRWRATAMAFLLIAAGVMAPLIYRFAHSLLDRGGTWRDGWVIIAALCAALGVLSFLVLRNTPESMRQLRDGARSLDELQAVATRTGAETPDEWVAKEAVRTPQFVLMVLCGLGYAVPWGVLANHGNLHLLDVGFESGEAAALLALMAFVSIFGRASGALGDRISPPRLLGLALAMEGTGMAMLLFVRTTGQARVALILLGLGFGMAYICQAATFARFFGRRAFATTTGVRFAVGAAFGATIPAVTGWAFDTQGTYAVPFLTIAAVTLTGSVVAFLLQAPRKKS
ncbi:MAG: MFS transporter [Acidobacteria bacterium]|nr:MFS transporter [Acidobacteriota bacterium]MXZ38411.1 MFS transporter [Holophagales bacterium]MYJ26018.1 MFS transporter [Holophagales bacterium]